MTQKTQTKEWNEFLTLVEKSNLPEFQAPLRNNTFFVRGAFSFGVLGMMAPFFMIIFGVSFTLAMTVLGLSLPLFLTGLVVMDSNYALKKRVEDAREREKTLKMIGEGLGLFSSPQRESYQKLHDLFKEKKGNAYFWKKFKDLHKTYTASVVVNFVFSDASLDTKEEEQESNVVIVKKEMVVVKKRHV